MTRRGYSCPFTGTITNAGGNTDLVTILAADDKPVWIDGFRIGQISEVGDAAEEGLSFTFHRFTATVTAGTGGSAVTAGLDDQTDTAFGGTCRVNDTAVNTTSGSALVLDEVAWNIRASPWETWFPESPKRISQGEAFIVRCNTTPADDITASWTLFFHEV